MTSAIKTRQKKGRAMTTDTKPAPASAPPAKAATQATSKAAPSPAPVPQQLALVQGKTAPSPAPAPTTAPAHTTKPGFVQQPIPEKVDGMLVHILSFCRAHESEGEVAFLGWLRTRLQAYLAGAVESVGKVKGEYLEHSDGAVSLTVFTKDEKATTTLFCSHIDTCDNRKDVGTKQLDYLGDFGLLYLADKSPGSCLGADDGVGIWLMLKMIEAKVPGTYLFHRGEEVGQSSAKAIVKKEAPWLSQFELAVELDRPGDYEVITHQRGRQECASNKFATALAAQLNKHGMSYKPSDSGVYTDVYEYRSVIAECVNIGVGYRSQHTQKEELDVAHAEALLRALIKVEWESLPVDRDPKAVPVYTGSGSYHGGYGSYRGSNGYGGHGGYQGSSYGKGARWFQMDDEPDEIPEHAFTKGNGNKAAPKPTVENKQFDLNLAISEVADMNIDEIMNLADQDSSWAATTIIALLLELESEKAKRQQLIRLLPLSS